MEIVSRCCFNAVTAIAVVDRVQVHQQDLVLAVFLLKLGRQLGFANLALDRDVVRFLREHGVAHQLHGDGGSALAATAKQVVREGSRDARQIDAVVLVEADIFGIDGCLFDQVAYLVAFDRVPFLQLELRQFRRPVGRIHDRLACGVCELGVIDAWQILGPGIHDAQGSLYAPKADEGKANDGHQKQPSNGVGAHFALFSSDFHS